MRLREIAAEFSVCKSRDIAGIPLAGRYCFAGKTEDEISFVCETGCVPPDCLDCEHGWRAFRVAGALDFSLIGILAGLTGALAKAGVAVFAVSTFDTDYLLVKKEKYGTAVAALRDAGYVWEPTVYYIGGSPCSGKSTAAEALAAKHGWRYFKLDDHLEEYIAEGARRGDALLEKVARMSLDEIWLRDPASQSAEERAIYRAIFPLARADIAAMGDGPPIVAEGAGFLPDLMRESGVEPSRYVCVTPTPGFQYARYSAREWVKDYLSGCSKPEEAFARWMERDALFAEAVRGQAEAAGYTSIVTDGSIPPCETARRVEAALAPL